MACESCKYVVQEALKKLKINPLRVELGFVELAESLSKKETASLEELISEFGMVLVKSREELLVENIKKLARDYVLSSIDIDDNFSTYIGQRLNYEYNYMSNIFSALEDCTIARYLMLLKVEFAKEMIMAENAGFSEIANKLGYSSAAHFSTQFKRVTGVSPSHFRAGRDPKRLAMHELTPCKP